MPAGGAVVSGLGILLGAGEAIWGGINKKKYQQQYDALSANRPKYNINQEEYDIENMAQNRANQGMGASAKNALQTNADRNIATLANAAAKGGADANALGEIADRTQQAYNQNAIYDDQARLQNLSNLQNVWARMSANKDKQWTINEEQPWKDKMTSLYGQIQGANNMLMGGLNMAGSGLMSLGGKLFSGGGSSGGGGGGQDGGSQGGGSEMPQGNNQGNGGQGGGQDYGGSNLGLGGYTNPFAASAPTESSPTQSQSVDLPANTGSTPYSNLYWQ